MKKVAIGLIAMLAVSTGVACASPTEMNEGKWNVTLGMIGDSDGTVDAYEWGVFDMESTTSLYGSVIYGMTDKWGLEVGYSRYNFDDRPAMNYDADLFEVNVLYKISPYANLFVGYVDGEFAFNYPESYIEDCKIDQSSIQAGIMGHYPLTDRVDAFGRLALGTDSHIYEVGMSYEFAPRWDLNVSYYDAQYRDFDYYGINTSLDVDGVRIGISTSF